MSATLPLILATTPLALTLSLRLAWAGYPCRAPGWRRQWRRKRSFLQHFLKLGIHRRGTAIGRNLRQLMAPAEFVLERMLAREIRRHLSFGPIGDLDDRIADPQPRLRGQLACAAIELLTLHERFGEVDRIDEHDDLREHVAVAGVI